MDPFLDNYILVTVLEFGIRWPEWSEVVLFNTTIIQVLRFYQGQW